MRVTENSPASANSLSHTSALTQTCVQLKCKPNRPNSAGRYDAALLILVTNEEIKVVVTWPLVASPSPHTPLIRKVRKEGVPRRRMQRLTCHRGELKAGSLFSCLVQIWRFRREVKSSSPARLPLLQVGRACWNFCKSKWLHLFANKSSPSALEWSIDPGGARTRDTASIWKA